MAQSIIRLSCASFIIGAALAGCGMGGPAHGPASLDRVTVVHMSNGLSFEPQTVRIKVGDTVEWRNTSLFGHTVTDDPWHGPEDMSLPVNAKPFDSGPIPAGQIYRHTFTEPGTYRYRCDPHHNLNMTGVVVVAAPG